MPSPVVRAEIRGKRVTRPGPGTDASASRKDRFRAGKALRRSVPRTLQAIWEPAKDRPDPIDLLTASDGGRVSSLVPIRYGRMSLSPLAFLRGSAAIMAHDLAHTAQTGVRVQLGGDAHLSNFGVFGTPEREEVFDVNDFDETLPGPWEWDLKRLTTSLVLAGRQNGFSRSVRRWVAARSARSYRRSMNRYASMRYTDIWYSHLDPDSVAREVSQRVTKVLRRYGRRARGRTGLRSFSQLVERRNAGYRIRDQPPLIAHYPGERENDRSSALFERYVATLPEERRMLLGRYRPVDFAQKVVGVGSVGTRCSIWLLVGDRGTDDPLLLQVKQALPSALEPYAGASLFANHAERVVVGQHLIQEASDIFLGWSTLRSEDFYVRQLHDLKFVADSSAMGPKALAGHGELCGAALARAHARTGDPARIAGYLGTKEVCDDAIATFSEAYAKQTERDHAELRTAIRNGRVAAEVDI